MTFAKLLDDTARRVPDNKVALVRGDQTWSYGAFNAMTYCVAGGRPRLRSSCGDEKNAQGADEMPRERFRLSFVSAQRCGQSKTASRMAGASPSPALEM